MPRGRPSSIVLAALVACGGDTVEVGVLNQMEDRAWAGDSPTHASWGNSRTLWLRQAQDLSQLQTAAYVNWRAEPGEGFVPPLVDSNTAWFDRSDTTRKKPFPLDPPDPRYDPRTGDDVRWCRFSRDEDVLDCAPHARFELAATTSAPRSPSGGPAGVGCHVLPPEAPESGSEVRSSVFVSVPGGAAVEVRRTAPVSLSDCPADSRVGAYCGFEVHTEVLPLRWEPAGEDWTLHSDEATWTCESWWNGWECTGETSFVLVDSDEEFHLCGRLL